VKGYGLPGSGECCLQPGRPGMSLKRFFRG
jgi:hypothetical protein